MTLTDELDNTAVVRFVNDTSTSSDMVVTDGSRFLDGQVFSINDGTTTRNFEFDSGYILAVPATGGAGIGDMETFLIDLDGFTDANLDGIDDNLPVPFEFDKDGVYIDLDGIPGPDNEIINIADNLTIVVPAAGGGVINDGDMISLTDGTTTYTLEFDKDGTLINPFANLPVNAANNRTIVLPATGGGVGGVQDGDTFRIDPDGLGAIPPVVFEFDSNGARQFVQCGPFRPFHDAGRPGGPRGRRRHGPHWRAGPERQELGRRHRGPEQHDAADRAGHLLGDQRDERFPAADRRTKWPNGSSWRWTMPTE